MSKMPEWFNEADWLKAAKRGNQKPIGFIHLMELSVYKKANANSSSRNCIEFMWTVKIGPESHLFFTTKEEAEAALMLRNIKPAKHIQSISNRWGSVYEIEQLNNVSNLLNG